LLHGDVGPDKVSGQAGADRVFGDGGDDTLWGGIGRDALEGDGGDDTLNARDGVRGNDRSRGGSGTDVCNSDPQDTEAACDG
jgi:Ca2+-binding RTX toxin-like protein